MQRDDRRGKKRLISLNDQAAVSVRRGGLFGIPPVIKIDIHGNVWCSMAWADPKEDRVRCYSAAGELLGKMHLPEPCANLVFGGPLRNRLYICASTSVYACYVDTQGAAIP